MAAQTQTINLLPTDISTFAGVPVDPASFAPNARVVFNGIQSITAKSAGDTNRLEVGLLLPQNNAYILDQLFIEIADASADGLDHYSNLGAAQLQFMDPGNQTDVMVNLVSQGSIVAGTAGTRKIWIPCQARFFSEVFYSRTGAGPRCYMYFYDTDGVNATGTLSMNYYASFLQYNVEQTVNVAVNAPAPVSVR